MSVLPRAIFTFKTLVSKVSVPETAISGHTFCGPWEYFPLKGVNIFPKVEADFVFAC